MRTPIHRVLQGLSRAFAIAHAIHHNTTSREVHLVVLAPARHGQLSSSTAGVPPSAQSCCRDAGRTTVLRRATEAPASRVCLPALPSPRDGAPQRDRDRPVKSTPCLTSPLVRGQTAVAGSDGPFQMKAASTRGNNGVGPRPRGPRWQRGLSFDGAWTRGPYPGSGLSCGEPEELRSWSRGEASELHTVSPAGGGHHGFGDMLRARDIKRVEERRAEDEEGPLVSATATAVLWSHQASPVEPARRSLVVRMASSVKTFLACSLLAFASVQATKQRVHSRDTFTRAASSPVVTVKNGSYEGVYSPEYDQDFFLGMRYAQVRRLASAHAALQKRQHVLPAHCSLC